MFRVCGGLGCGELALSRRTIVTFPAQSLLCTDSFEGLGLQF